MFFHLLVVDFFQILSGSMFLGLMVFVAHAMEGEGESGTFSGFPSFACPLMELFHGDVLVFGDAHLFVESAVLNVGRLNPMFFVNSLAHL
jgi:hypothetical protein